MSDLKSTVGPALGKIPSGLAIATAQHGGERTGFLASWFQQVSFEPALVAVCIKAGRPIEGLIKASGHFALNLVAEGDFGALKRYGKGFEPGVDPWAEDPATLAEGHAAPVFAQGYAYLVLKHVRTLDAGGDHLLHIGEVVSGELQDPERKPYIHIRKDGFNY
ncbi:MAG TPA: flavin reductase family protein [Holophagaceae bacterium]|nr:flavin reductase family protein [Holophagaceae bacterium]